MKENEAAEKAKGAAAGETPADKGGKLYTQSELDSALENERKELGKKLAEAEKLAAMTESKRADYKREQREKELEKREAAVAKRELMADALGMINDAGLPVQLAKCLDYSDRGACEESFEAVKKAFGAAVSAAVGERMRGCAPKRSAAGSVDAFLDGLGVK
ncbi:MAG: DUF4355 domain-containing protein [Ruminiclostridium sp.]|nr:DUF4355 domain-containing protein [Ruminiclostridium sp.]